MSQDARYDEEQSTLRRAQVLGLTYTNTATTDKPLFKDFLTNQELYSLRVVPLNKVEGNLLFGVTTNTSQQTMQSLLQRFADFKVTFSLISDTGYREYMRLYDPPPQVVYQDINISHSSQAEISQISTMLQQVRADDMLAYLVSQAHRLNASDIHIETQEHDVRIRFRLDGVLHPVANLNIDKYRVLISAVASAGNVSTSTDEAQQGHIEQKVKMADGTEVSVNVRLETVPTINGMDVVMRLFNMNTDMYHLDKLGLNPSERKVVDDIINKPSGLVMVVGPTGSGKTTTLYSMLNSLNTPERKIITIEDPVEFQFPGITQISVKTSESGNDNSFADKLRAVLRLDPDVVMVGEIRDLDTAKTALQASLTGHLVLATFHASSAAASLTRIADIIGQNPLFISAIRLIMAQRLIRKLDDKTKRQVEPNNQQLEKIHSVINSFPVAVAKPDLTNIKLFEPGKSNENPYGFDGQMAVREQLTMTPNIRSLLEDPKLKITAQGLEAAAIKDGMLTIEQDGMLKVLAGLTTLDELYRVVG